MPVRGLEKRGQVTLFAMAACGLFAAVAGLASAYRTSVLPAPYGYIEYDRWTGAVTACAVEAPVVWTMRLQGMLQSAGFSEKEVSDYMLKQWRDDGALVSRNDSNPLKTCVRSY